MQIDRHQSLLLILNLILVYLSAYLILGRRRGVGRGNGVIRVPCKNWDVDRTRILRRSDIISDRVCHDQLRMRRSVFHGLCCRLRTFGLVDTRYVVVEEQVAMFLLTVGHDQHNRNILMQFYRSGQTVSHFFHLVLNALIQLYRTVVPHATEDNSPDECRYPMAWHDYFKDAVGIVNGTHTFKTVKELCGTFKGPDIPTILPTIQSLPGLDAATKWKAYFMLGMDVAHAALFMGMSEEDRPLWLIAELAIWDARNRH